MKYSYILIETWMGWLGILGSPAGLRRIVLPQVMPVVLGTIIFEWDINIRRSAVMGLVGAGGLGLTFFRQMAIDQIGMPGLILGSIDRDPLAELWNSALLRQYREGHRKRLSGQTPICRGCAGF